MKKFEVGKRYEDCGATFEVIKRSAKFVTVAYIHHPGRYNEKRAEPKRLGILIWPDGSEVVCPTHYELHA